MMFFFNVSGSGNICCLLSNEQSRGRKKRKRTRGPGKGTAVIGGLVEKNDREIISRRKQTNHRKGIY
jgi:hypothetical protein